MKRWPLYACLQPLPPWTAFAEVTALCWAGDRLYSGSADMSIKIWDVATQTCLNTILPPASGVASAATTGGFSAALAARSTGAVPVAPTGPEGHCSPIVGLDLLIFGNMRMLVSGSYDGAIKVSSVGVFVLRMHLIGWSRTHWVEATCMPCWLILYCNSRGISIAGEFSVLTLTLTSLNCRLGTWRPLTTPRPWMRNGQLVLLPTP